MDIHAIIQRKRKNRRGKGFSQNELKEAGIDPNRALKLGIPIDLRRKTKHLENVELLERYLRSLGTPK